MVTRRLSCAFLVLAMTAGGSLSWAASDASDEQAVKAGEQTWLKSQQTNNTDLLAPLLADKVVETTEQGKVYTGKDAVIAQAKTDKWSSADYKDLKVSVFGRTAIATGLFVGKGTSADGQSMDVQVRFTDTWIKQADGKWQCVASHDSPVKM
jgi:uncharacterized protein (TIGR02246 family)